MLSVNGVQVLAAVGHKGEVPPVGKELGLIVLGVKMHAADDQPLVSQPGLGELADARLWIVGHGLPGLLGDQSDPLGHDSVHRHRDRVAAALGGEVGQHLLVPEGRVGADQDLTCGASATHPGDQLLDEAKRAASRARLPLAQADVQHLARARAGSEDRVVAALAGVAEAGALLGGTVHLPDEGVDVDHKALTARSRAGHPGSPDRLRQHPIELAHMPEAERAQEGAERRGRHHAVSKQRLGAAGPQHVAIVDRIGSKAIACTSEQTLRPGFAAPARWPRSTIWSTSRSRPSRLIRVLVNITPALATKRSSSNSTATESGRTATSECYTMR